LFDLDGTLYNSTEYSKRLEAEIVTIVAGMLRLSEQETNSILKKKRKEIGTLTGALRSLKVNQTEFFEDLAGRMTPSQYLSKDPAVLSVLGELKDKGVKIGLVSNSGRALVKKILQAIGIDESVFETIVTSDDAAPKPSPEPFLLALRQLGCTINDAIYVGDRAEAELRPAQELGIRTILVSSEGPPTSPWATVVVRSVTEIPQIVTLLDTSDLRELKD
jgi:HAD superfamily hydrolase (TIGR01509 family)